jgi:hypothetical protein
MTAIMEGNLMCLNSPRYENRGKTCKCYLEYTYIAHINRIVHKCISLQMQCARIPMQQHKERIIHSLHTIEEALSANIQI